MNLHKTITPILPQNRRTNILGLSRPQLSQWISSTFPVPGDSNTRAKIIYKQLFREPISQAASLRDVHKELKDLLQSHFNFAPTMHIDLLQQSSADGTVKFLFRLEDGKQIESVLIPERGRLTLCVSSQVGCRQACRFCHTGTMGLLRNLTSAEIIGQVVEVNKWLNENKETSPFLKDHNGIRNVVFMGMGEPLDNLDDVITTTKILTDSQSFHLSNNRITVSTVGLLPQLQTLHEQTNVCIALSLHSPFEDERSRLMPVNKSSPLQDILSYLKSDFPRKRNHYLIQYLLIRNVNDSEKHALALAETLQGIPVKINLIPYNEHDGAAFCRPDIAKVYSFQSLLKSRGYVTTIRLSKGREVAAACGQLVKETNT